MSEPSPLERTFQLVSGVGPYRERLLWSEGVRDWAEFDARRSRGAVLTSVKVDEALSAAIVRARAAVAAGEVAVLGAMVPEREHWRLYPTFCDQAAFFDLEADGEQEITVGGLMDRDGLGVFFRHQGLEPFVERLSRSAIWVTFNGAVFDVPVLRRTFPELQVPPVHVDLRTVLRKVKLSGGLKALEEKLGLGRPPHLKGLRGMDAIRLWREFTENKHVEALRFLAEYNLYDAINLRSLLEWSVNAIGDAWAWEAEKRPVFERGEVLYDLSRLVLSLGGTGQVEDGSDERRR